MALSRRRREEPNIWAGFVDAVTTLLMVMMFILTILTVAHDLNLAALYCRRLVFLKNGSVAADGPTRDVFTAQTLSDIYETPLAVAPHPVTGAPQAYLVPRA